MTTEAMAERIRMALGPRADIVEKRIIGGIGFMLDGHLMAGTSAKGTKLFVRLDPAETAAAMQRPGASQMRMGDKPMEGYALIDGDAIAEATDFVAWLNDAERFVRTLPAK